MKKIRGQEITMLLLGSFILAVSLYHFHFQNNLAEGGFLGLAFIIERTTGVSPAISTFAMDLIVLAFAWRLIGKKLVQYTLLGASSFSVFYFLLETYSPFVVDLKDNMFLAALIGGILSGIGLGMILRFGGATGGDEVLAFVFSKKSKFTIGQLFFALDVIVIGLSLSYLTWTEVAYTILAMAICAKVMDVVYYTNSTETKPVPEAKKGLSVELPKKHAVN